MRPTTFVTAIAIAGFAMGSAIAQQAPGSQGQTMGQNQAFCLQKADGSKNCSYATMAQCDSAKKGDLSASCARNLQTTGSGAPSQPGSNAAPSNPSGSRGSANPSNPK
ncbi:MAG: DUF3551 domain-containing protein [Xanthobacteraceae bacterium]|jgi:hypothetical protein